MRVVALDHGSARCGVAVSDPSGTLATPAEPVLAPDTRKGLGRVVARIEELGAERVVVGLPLSLSGGDSAQTRAARAFAERLQARLPRVPVELYDERFTTRIAAAGGGAASLDSRAAAVLLDDWLTAHAS